MFWARMPYPRSAWSTSTWVTAPTSLPSWRMGGAGHPLDDAPGLLQQPGIGDPEHQVPGVPAVVVDLEDLHGVLLHLGAGDVGEDGGLAGVDFRLLGHRHRGAGDGLRVLEVPKDAALGVGV